MTKTEVVLWQQLREANRHGFKFRRQHPIRPYIADFVHLRGQIVVEIDGATHWTAERAEHDRRRDLFLRDRGWTVMRFNDREIHEDVGRIVEDIVRRIPVK